MSKTCVTIQGDCWDAIAYRLWGDEGLFRALMDANPEYLDTAVFEGGVKLVVPERPAPAVPAELPPWRQ